MERGVPSVVLESAAWISAGALAALLWHPPLAATGEATLARPAVEASLVEPRELKLIASDLVFAPARLESAPSEWLRITMLNSSDESHGLEFRLPGGRVALDGSVAPGETGVLELIAPERPGLYDFYCPLDDHRVRGMDGFLVVTRGSGD